MKRIYLSIKKIPLYARILLGMLIGAALGLIAVSLQGETFVQQWIRPWGTIFIRLLQLTAIPLVFISLIKGVTSLHEVGKVSRMGLKTVGIYLLTTIFAICLGLGIGSVVKPGKLIDSSQVLAIEESNLAAVQGTLEKAEQALGSEPLSALVDIIPENMMAAFSSNGKMLQVIFLALFFAIAILSVGVARCAPLLRVIDIVYDLLLRMIDFIIAFAPYGVAALIASLVCTFSGNLSLFAALGAFMLTVAVALLILMLGFYPLLIKLFTKIKPPHFIRDMYPTQLLAFSTSSSAATLPFTMKTVQKKLGVSSEVASFVLPIGVTINMDGTSLFQTLSVLFIAQALGIDLTLSQMVVIVVMTTISSIGTPGIPGGSFVVLTMVLTAVGIPVEGLALILGIDRPLDMLRTSVNVTGDATVAAIVDRSEGDLDNLLVMKQAVEEEMR